MDKDKMKVWVEMLKCNPDDPCAYDNSIKPKESCGPQCERYEGCVAYE